MGATTTHDIRIRGLTVQYPGRDRAALDGVSFDALPGTITAVVGPNGSGKSTIVRALLRRVAVAAGSISIGDNVVSAMDPRAFAQRVAVVPQREEPARALSVTDFVGLGRHAHRSAFGVMRTSDRAAIDRAMARAGMTDAMHQRIDQLSGGEWQRVRIARALAQEAAVLVLDEPTTFLDIGHEMAVFELLDAIAREGCTVLLVSHQLNLVARFASHIVLLHAGTVVASGSADVVMRGDVLEAVYDWPLVITRDPAVGAPSLLPLRRQARPVRDRVDAPTGRIT